MITNTMRMVLNEAPQSAEDYDYVIEISKHDTEVIEDLKSIGWEEFNSEMHRDIDSEMPDDMLDTIWLGLSRTV